MHIFIFDTTASHVKFTCKHQNKFIDEGKTRLSTNLRSIEFPNAMLVEVLFKICFFCNCRKCIGYDHKIKFNIMIIASNFKALLMAFLGISVLFLFILDQKDWRKGLLE